MKAYEQQGSKVVRQGAQIVQRRPLNPEVAPTISLLMQVPGPQVDQHIGREHECYQRIALLSQRIPANILSHGCKMEIVLLCKTKDLVVTSMLDTGCSPGNYISMAFYKAIIDSLQDFLVPGPAERVDLATSDSAQSISLHLVIEARHVDSRGVNRTIKLRFGVLLGLRFDVVIGLYAIALNFMEVMQDLLLLQLEHQEARTHTLAMLYGQTAQLLMMSAADNDDTDQSLDSIETTGPRPPRPPIIAGLTLQTMLRNPWYFDEGQIEDQRAYELVYPQPHQHHNDTDTLMSCDAIESNIATRYNRAMDYLIRERESAPPSTLPVVPSCPATSDDDNVEDDLEDYSDMPGLKEDTDGVVSNEVENHPMIQHPQIPETPSSTQDNDKDPLSSLYPQLYLRISPTAMVWGSPEDIALHQRMPYRYLVSSRSNVYSEEEHDRAWEASVTSPIERVQYRAFIQLFRGSQARHRRAILSQLPIAPAVLTRDNAIVTTFETGVPTRGSSAASLDEASSGH